MAPVLNDNHFCCSINIRPVDAQRAALAAGQNGTLSPFRIFVEDDQAVADRSCWVKMLDATVSPRRALGGAEQYTAAQLCTAQQSTARHMWDASCHRTISSSLLLLGGDAGWDVCQWCYAAPTLHNGMLIHDTAYTA
jgi:hypothetical protein